MSDPGLLPILCAEQRARWQRGEPVRAEHLLARHPGLAADPERLLDLVYQEVILREQAGEELAPEEYYRRFPALAEQLRLIFEVHRALPAKASVADPCAALQGLPALPGYDVLAEIGRGGGGVVYQARHRALQRVVAVKMLAAGAGASSRATRIRAEALLAARLCHPNIVAVYEVGEQEGRPFFAMEYVEGGSLAARLAGAPQPPEAAARLVATLAQAVHYAHERGVIHRDLKPANVLLVPPHPPAPSPTEGERGGKSAPAPLSPCGGRGVGGEGGWIPKIADFGLAKDLREPGPTQTGDVMGTPAYMAPEQALGRVRAVGPRTDVYALGAILYECLTGRPPFNAATPLEALRLVAEEDPVPPDRLVGRVPRDLQTICLACLRKEPSRRYASARELADDLQRFLEGRPVKARPASAVGRLVRWAQRRPASAALVVVAALSALTLGTVVWRDQRRLHATHAEARQALDESQRARRGGDWPLARSLAAGVCQRLAGEPRLRGLLREAEALREEADRVVRFRRARDEALFRGLLALANDPLSTGLDAATHRRRAREAAASALAERANLPAEEAKDTLALRLLAVEGLPPAEALRALETPEVNSPPARAYHLRRAHYLDLLGDRRAVAERGRARDLPPRSALDHFLVGHEHLRRGDVGAARQAFEKAVSAQHDHFWAQCFLAVCNAREGRLGEARAALTVCITVRPDFVWGWLLHGNVQRQHHAFASAEADLARAEALLRQAPDEEASYALLVNRGVLRLDQADAERAAQAAGLVALAPTSAWVLTGAAGWGVGSDYLSAAGADLEQAVRLRPRNFAAHLNLAGAYLRQGRLEDYDRAQRRGFALASDQAVRANAAAQRGRLLLDQGRPQEALQWLRAVPRRGSWPSSWRGRRWWH